MKKLSTYFLSMFLMLSIGFLSSCGNDEEEPAPNNTVALSNERAGILGNKQGPEQGAYNLVADSRVSSSAADSLRDMQNMTEQTTTDLWTPAWSAASATRYVKAAAGFDYTNATVESASSAYTAGSPLSSVANPAVGDIYIAKLRGRNEYAVIKITAINKTTTDNLDNVQFTYRKKS